MPVGLLVSIGIYGQRTHARRHTIAIVAIALTYGIAAPWCSAWTGSSTPKTSRPVKDDFSSWWSHCRGAVVLHVSDDGLPTLPIPSMHMAAVWSGPIAVPDLSNLCRTCLERGEAPLHETRLTFHAPTLRLAPSITEPRPALGIARAPVFLEYQRSPSGDQLRRSG